MEKGKFTPGPWEIINGNEKWIGGCVISDGKRSHLATALRGNHDAEANAHLIAAAPDMLDCLLAILEQAEAQRKVGDKYCTIGRSMLFNIEEAIQKAIGE